ncbi:MAG: right-handed parallel beta-helix repeat-containing protein [Anaerolineae bacterium]|nr:right-handed parallel beta-helix repeat-containing protein [Anaerolineae bacterium]
MKKLCLTTGVLVIALTMQSGFWPLPARSKVEAVTLYVDNTIGVSQCNQYNPATRSCSGGSATAYATLGGAAAAAQAGDTVLIRQGTYDEQLAPQNSGTAGAPITYRSYLSETVTLSGDFYPGAILLDGVSYIVVEGLTVANSRWLEATGAHYNVIRNNTFLRTPATGTTGNVRFISSDHNRIEGNVMDTGNDNLLLIDSDYNLVQGNVIREGRHSIFGIRCGNYNLLRDNYFSNTIQKIGEVYDCGEDTSAVPHAFNAAHHNVIEHNIFADADSYYSTSGGNGIQYAGQDGIIRRNVFYHTNVGLGMQVYGDEALYNHNNRVVHNVFYDNDCAGIAVRGDNVGNVYKNNILFANKGVGGASGDCFGDGPAQILYRNPMAGFYFERNNLFNTAPGEAVIQQEFGSGNTLATFETNYPDLFSANLETEPGFNNAGGYDFTLKNDSLMINAGTFLAHAVNNGSGTALAVDDARYFSDGFGIEGATGDLIQLEGQTETAVAVGVDYEANVLTLDRPLSWEAGQGVSLAYTGDAPDMGAYELEPSLELQGMAADRAIHLSWTVNVTLPATSTWTISYESPGTVYLPITGLTNTLRDYNLTGLVNYTWYTVTLSTAPSLFSDTIRLMPTDKAVYLPLILR